MNKSTNQSQSDQEAGGILPEPEALLFETSPYGTLDAIVQHDGRSVYLYLNQSPNSGNTFGTRACWVRNLTIGPYVINEDEMKSGIPPMLPRTDCVDRDGLPIPNPEHLSIVWFEEGNGVALIETDDNGDQQTLAIIPPWSGLEGFHGYSAQCATETPLCWPMPDNPKLEQRIQQARQFWASFGSSSDSNANPFSQLQSLLLECYNAQFAVDGVEPEYFTIDGGKFPPRGLIQYRTQTHLIMATVGMSLCPQPAVELFNDQPFLSRRIELAIELPISIADKTEQLEKVTQQICNLASYPWRNFTWLGAGHTCQLTDISENCEAALLVKDIDFLNSDALKMPKFRDDPINLLFLMPISSLQKQQLEENSISPKQIVAQFRDR